MPRARLPRKWSRIRSRGTERRCGGSQIGKRHYRIVLGDVIEAHEQALEHAPGLPGISNLDSILGAIARPYHGYHRRIHAKAAALLHGIATSHGFNDANKRTAWLTTEVLIANSGFRLDMRPEDRLDDLVVDVVTGVVSQDALEMWFEDRITKEKAG